MMDVHSKVKPEKRYIVKVVVVKIIEDEDTVMIIYQYTEIIRIVSDIL